MATIYYDSFKITAPDKVGMRAYLLIDEPIKPDGNMSTLTSTKGT
jgi:AraC family transcriptional regulator